MIISKNSITKYHVLFIPVEHYEDFTELPNEVATHIILITKRLSKAMRKLCNPDAITYIFDDDISNIDIIYSRISNLILSQDLKRIYRLSTGVS